MPRSSHGGRHELGQNFLVHTPTLEKIANLIAGTQGPILEIGSGNGALTRHLARLQRPLTAIDIDEHRVAKLRQRMPGVTVEQADVLAYPLTTPVVVGNVPFHITTPILRRLLATGTWQHAVLLTQWEVARRRAGVGGSTLLTAQTAPWFTFTLHGRVPSTAFHPRPGVDGGIIHIIRRPTPLVPVMQRRAYERFVRAIFTGRGGNLDRIVQQATQAPRDLIRDKLRKAGISPRALPRDLRPEQWATLWGDLNR
ncbi:MULTISPECIES: 23S ribosomal RNA methyltransferase Erm [Dietzia]|uniref:23S ribosomal RNA methyltransferase Erm n=1 Tax=Dietzia TaxID=37914 RepID=UPI0009D96A79|nr:MULTISPECIES: 23S ribosomal RNA methyltransferase Erm [Dietzia]MCT1434212.1 23S ribosomal RNA methyltransferase Erm [Dietzia maris]MCT1521245.1 23S ribosomal RNA methyltransferase Erm [Dietzia maris]USX47914.1 23S ribosomal RNA methyltransferase Erm [Dietzia kunjamensis]